MSFAAPPTTVPANGSGVWTAFAARSVRVLTSGSTRRQTSLLSSTADCVASSTAQPWAVRLFQVAAPHARVKLQVLRVHAAGLLPIVTALLEAARQAELNVQVEQHRQIRKDASGGERVHMVQRRGFKAKPAALIRHGRRGKPVAHHDAAAAEPGAESLSDVLGARREHEQRLHARLQIRQGSLPEA